MALENITLIEKKLFLLKDEKFTGLINGDAHQIKRIYDEHLDSIINWVINNSGDRESALDIFQDAIEVIITKGADPNFILKKSLGAYLFTICKYLWFQKLREKKLHAEVRNKTGSSHIIGESDIINEIESQTLLEILLQKTLKNLSPLCQRLMIMIKEEKKSLEITSTLGFNSVKTMYRRKFACMEKWRQLIMEAPLYHQLKKSL